MLRFLAALSQPIELCWCIVPIEGIASLLKFLIDQFVGQEYAGTYDVCFSILNFSLYIQIHTYLLRVFLFFLRTVCDQQIKSNLDIRLISSYCYFANPILSVFCYHSESSKSACLETVTLRRIQWNKAGVRKRLCKFQRQCNLQIDSMDQFFYKERILIFY